MGEGQGRGRQEVGQRQDRAGKKWVKGKVDAGKKWASGKLAGAKKWFKGKAESASDWFQKQIAALKKLVFRDSFDVDGEAHSIFTEPGNPAVAYVASGKKKVSDADLGPALAALNDEYKAVMTDYWATISQKTGGKADKALIRQAGKLRSKGKALIKRMVAAAQKAMRQGQDPGMHAPHIGEILAHRAQGEPAPTQEGEQQCARLADGVRTHDPARGHQRRILRAALEIGFRDHRYGVQGHGHDPDVCGCIEAEDPRQRRRS